jgi:hypothetical protein
MARNAEECTDVSTRNELDLLAHQRCIEETQSHESAEIALMREVVGESDCDGK